MCRLYCLFAICFLHQFCLPLTVAFHPVHPIVGALLGPHFLQRSLCRNQTKVEGHLKLVDAPRSMVGLIDYLLLRAVVLTSFLVPQEFFFIFSPQAQLFICKGIVSISSSAPVYFLMECLELLHMAR